ncbi:hypothetical protein SCLCIDRAFT_9448 [Scleroderma citrinum Foug A]|uniref:Uncharacterized protein n=1 Tax=Scleroderma citrinum Foug A TaxID=1036808 RepID=A0A0C3A908_9AGAM|nr:hypothetical protein SCLCIDRAFT_9448 [Scleroderma citrinum Foug A]
MVVHSFYLGVPQSKLLQPQKRPPHTAKVILSKEARAVLNRACSEKQSCFQNDIGQAWDTIEPNTWNTFCWKKSITKEKENEVIDDEQHNNPEGDTIENGNKNKLIPGVSEREEYKGKKRRMESTEDNNRRKKYKSTAIINSDEEDNENMQPNPGAASSTSLHNPTHGDAWPEPQSSNANILDYPTVAH